MTPGPASSAKTSPPRTSSGLKLLLGCGVVLGVLFFGSCLAAGGVGVYLATTPGQIELESLVGDQSLGVLQLHADLEDPGVRSLFDAFFDAMERVQSEAAAQADLPAALQALQGMGNNSNRQQLTWIFPIEGIVVVEATDNPEVLGAINLDYLPRAYARSLDWISSLEEEASEEFVEHRGHTIVAGDDGAFSMVGGSILMATGLEQMTAGIDRIEAAKKEDAATAGEGLREALTRLEGHGDAELILRLDSDELRTLARGMLEEADPELTGGSAALGECQRLEGWLDLVDADTLLLHLELRCTRDPFGWDLWLELFADALLEIANEEGLDFEHETREREGFEPGVILDAEITGLEALVAGIFDPPEPE